MDGRDIRTLATELDSTMRLVRELVREVQLGASEDQVRGRLVDLAGHLTRRPDLGALPALVTRAYAEVIAALGGIRLGREAMQSDQQLGGIGPLLEEIEARLRATAVLFNERTPATGEVDHDSSNGDAG